MSIEYNNLDKKITKTLITIGVNPGILGYRYLQTAIQYAIKDNSYVNYITTKLYPTIAEIHNSTPSRVERAIRHAIERLFLNTDINRLHKIFGNIIDVNSGKITNATFIAFVVEYIRTNYSDIKEVD